MRPGSARMIRPRRSWLRKSDACWGASGCRAFACERDRSAIPGSSALEMFTVRRQTRGMGESAGLVMLVLRGHLVAVEHHRPNHANSVARRRAC